ncbi:MAG: immunoglobulin domain-containing protein, partial [Opitutaceae bacterium]
MNIVRRFARVCLGAGLLIASVASVWAQAPTVTPTSAARQVVNRGQNLTLNVSATGNPAPTLQWRRNGVPIVGAVTSSYTIVSAIATRDTGWYQVVATNTGGTVVSTPIFVNVAMNPAQVVPWGAVEVGLSTIPPGLTNLLGVATGAFHSLALRAEGTVVAWGSNGFNQTAIPAGLVNVVALAAGEVHTLALRSDRTVVAWGHNGFGQSTVPGGLANVVSVAAGEVHSLALRADGTVVAWGDNPDGRATVPPGLVNVVALAAGFSHSAALRSDGTVAMWGSPAFGVLNQPAGLNTIVAIAAGDFHTLALRANGTVAAWGSNDERSMVPAGLSNVVAIAAGNAHSLALRADGSVVGWGSNIYQESTPPAGLNNVVGIAASGVHSLALRNATSGNLPLSPITQHPGSTGVAAGQTASFSVAATGAPTYQWLKEGVPIPGATGATYTTDPTIPSDAGEYSVVVTDGGASFTSNPATLTVNLPNGFPLIVGQPVNVTVTAGAPAGFTTAVTGNATAPVSYQWRKGSTTINGATNATFAIASTVPGDAGSYSVRVSNSAGSGAFDISRQATLTVNVIPVITVQPASVLATVGGPVGFTVVATGSPSPTYQWRKGGNAIAGATGSTFNIASTTLNDAGSFDVIVSNVAGSVTSNPAMLTVTPAPTAPVITSQPASQNAAAGSSVSFNVAASGVPAPTFQWRKGTDAIAGATGVTLSLTNVTTADSGNYTVVAANSVGSVTSNTAVLAVNPANPGRLLNLSILTSITAANPLFTVGTFVGGAGTTGSKAVLVRAGGPSLAQFVGAGAISDPQLDIFAGQTVVASNDNWGGGAGLSAAFAQVGAFAFAPPASRDAAVLNSAMPIGAQTVQISGVGGATGMVIAELYDATPATAFTITTPRLVNVSVLKQIDAGAPLTAGFVVGGATSRTVLVRAIGPTLADAPFSV